MIDWRTSYRGRRVLVLGASGFIGRWVAQALTEAGAVVFCAVRDPVGSRPVLAEHGVTEQVVRLDVTDLAAVEALLGQLRPAVVFNLAGYGVDRTERDEQLARQINADLPHTLAAALSQRGGSDWPGYALVHTGSALEYGAVGGNLAESGAENPTTLYGITKLAGTRAIERCGDTTALAGITARLFTVYGPGEHDGRLVPTLVAATQHSEPIPLSEGRQRRDFTYVEDVAEGLLRLGTARGPAGWTVNLATGNLATVREFTEAAARVLRLDPARLRFGAIPTRPEEMEHLAVAVERLRELLGWVPETDPAAGLSRTAAWLSRRAPAEPA